ncbi:hypothetical protein A9Q81_21550 [Gammaproteobacteria bacterium 42_54_T18]|nr:hypothetical protein A9Q81_21550 [Gammaproteobacteria bacterium 42_54_T18]
MTDATAIDSTPSQPPSYLASWALLVAQAIDSYGLDSQQIFQEAGADLTRLKKNDARFPCQLMAKVWHIAVARSHDPFIAIRVAQCFKPSVYGALGMTIVASRHVYDALLRVNRFASFIGNAHVSSLLESQTELSLVLSSKPAEQPLSNIYGMSATLCCLYKILTDVSVGKLKINAVHFEHSLASSQQLEDFFDCPVFYGASSNKIVLDKSSIFSLQPFPQNQLACALDHWLEKHLASHHQKLLSTRVQKILLSQLLYEDIDLTKVASMLAMSVRALQRKLQAEGTVYSKLLDDCRKKLSIELILDNRHQMSEVSSMMGFSDQSNFTRAFKRWTGTTPLNYRDCTH